MAGRIHPTRQSLDETLTGVSHLKICNNLIETDCAAHRASSQCLKRCIKGASHIDMF